MAVFNSSLCQITWTEVVHESQRFAFQGNKPLQLRFGLWLAPAFWSSFASANYYIDFQIFQLGYLRSNHVQHANTSKLPGAPNHELWLGMKFGKAYQVTGNRDGLFVFRPQIWFMRFGSNGYIPGEFAVASEEHCFAVEKGGPVDGMEFESEQFVGGIGRP
jgi:hypothetical protein